MKEIFTVGHSTRKAEEFAEILKEYGIEQIADIRTVPKSAYNPQFNSDFLEKSLESRGIKYAHLEKLGGLRHARKDSENPGWKNKSFRGFADYMQTPEFEEGLEELVRISDKKKTAIMCAEAVPGRCHRSLVADALVSRGIKVIHILGEGSSREHEMTSFAKAGSKGRITYPGRDSAYPARKEL